MYKFWVVFIVIIAIIWHLFPSTDPPSFFQKFSNITNNSFEEIDRIHLPAVNKILEHSVTCRKLANIIQRSPAFEFHGCQISTGLRGFGDKIKTSSYSLREMYNKGSEVYKSFIIEIEAMSDRLNSSQKQDDAKFFNDRLSNLRKNSKKFSKAVEMTQNSIIIAKVIKNDNEHKVKDGLKGAEDFVRYDDRNSNYFIDIIRAKEDLEIINQIFNHLNNIYDHLDQMKKILMIYSHKLFEISDEFKEFHKFKFTKKDLNYLRFSIDNLKLSYHKFIQKSL